MSNSVETDSSFLRQMGFADPRKFKFPVTILGAGSVGSAAALAVSKMGVKDITLIDYDVFEAHNISNQLCFEHEHIGIPKVEALANLIFKMAPSGVVVHPYQRKLVGTKLVDIRDGELVDAKSFFRGIVLNCPDDMDARKNAWELCKFNPKVPYVIDLRMAAQYLKIYIASTMQTRSIQDYEKTLHGNEDASQDPCGMRSIIYTSLIAGALAAKFVKSVQLGEPMPSEYEMDIHNGTTKQLVRGIPVASAEEHAQAYFG